MRRCKYVSDLTGKIIDGYEVKWVLDNVIECMTYGEALQGSRDYDKWIDSEQCESDMEDEVDPDTEPNTVNEDVMNVLNVDDTQSRDDLRDHCRELMMMGECDEQYHSDDESFMIGGDGNQKGLD